MAGRTSGRCIVSLWSRRRNRLIALVVCLGAMTFSQAAAMDVSDYRPTWTREGKELARERAKLPLKAEMVRVPEGWFLMGSDRKRDRMAYKPEFPQRKVYLDAFKIDKYEVTALQFLRFVLATEGDPLIDWKYDGGNFQQSMEIGRAHV